MSDSEERAETPDEERAPERPRKKKRKKKRAGAEPPLLDAAGRERPRFLLRFPADPELDRLVRAFEAGDYQAVREGAPALAERTSEERIREAAFELERRVRPDPLIKYLLLASVVLLAFLVLHAYARPH